MNKPVINKLKYPMWFQIVFYCSTVAIPVCLILAEGLTSKQSWFKWSFALIATIVIAWSAIYKWLLTGMRDKIAERKTKLEHDYEIDVGDTNKIKYIWFSNEQKLAIVDAVNILVWGAFIFLVSHGIAKGFMAIKAASLSITALYVIAYVIKFLVITYMKGYEYPNEEGDKGNE